MTKSHHPMRRWRFERGVTLAKLASHKTLKNKAKLAHLSKIENGISEPSPELIRRLSAITGIPAGDFVNFKAAK